VEPSKVDSRGRATFPSAISWGVVGFYLVLLLLLLTVSLYGATIAPYVLYALVAVLIVFLVRYLSTRYWMDSDRVGASRLFGSRHADLEDVRRIEFANLRDLGPTGFFGSWGYRGRMWSPSIGPFDSIHTVSNGVLVTAGGVPFFVSPKDPGGFARELSRRARSNRDAPLEIDAGESVPTQTPEF